MLGRLQGYTRSVLQRQGLPIPHSLAVENIARPEEANWSTALAPAPMANAGYAASPWDPWSFASRLGLNDEGAQFLASLPEELLKASIQSFDPAGTKDGNVWGRLLGFIRGLWMKRLQLNEEAISCVKNLSEEALMQVMISFHPGPKDGNLSARLIAFAKNLSWSGPMQHQGSYEQQWQDPSAAMPTPSPSAPISYAPPRAQARSASSVIWELATYWQLDQGCIDFLMQLPDEIKWEISTGFNPWGAKDGNIWGRLLGFIRVLVAQWVGWDRAKVEYMKTLPEEQQKEMILTSLSAVYQGYTNQAVWSPARWGLGARSIFCPPRPLPLASATAVLGADRLTCGPDEHVSAKSIDLEVRLERLLFGMLSRSYEIPRGALGAEVSRLLQTLLQKFQEGLEALRLLACTWTFRLCFANSSIWWQSWGQLSDLLEKTAEKMVAVGYDIFETYGVHASLVRIPKPVAVQAGRNAILEMSLQAESFYQAFTTSMDPIFGDVIPQVLEHRKRFNRQALGLKIYSPDFPPEVPGSQLWQSYPASFADTCQSVANLPWYAWHDRRQDREGRGGGFDMSGLRIRHRTIEEVVEEIAEVQDLSFQVLNLGAMDGRCSGGPSTDPANCLLQGSAMNRSWGGVVVEAAPPPKLWELFGKRHDVVIVDRAVFPENASRVFDFGLPAPNPPRSLDLLKIDLDSFDCDVVSSLLRAARNFSLLHVELFNAVLVREDIRGALFGTDLKHLFPELRLLDPYQQWAQGYFCHPLARVLWHRERDIRWLGTDPRAWAQGSHKNIDETGESILQMQAAASGPTPPPTQGPSAPSGTPTLKQFVDRWGLDERAGQFLQALPHHVLQVVLSAFDASASADGNVWGRLLGFVRSTWGRTLKLPLEEVSHLKTMPDLVQVQIITEYDPAGGMRLVDFANQMLQASGMASEMPALPAPVPPVDPQAVDAFIVRCGLDASARDMLMALPPEKLNHVMETFNPDGTKDGNVLGRLEGYIRSMSVFRQGAKRARIY
eukprot:s202_g10.t2